MAYQTNKKKKRPSMNRKALKCNTRNDISSYEQSNSNSYVNQYESNTMPITPSHKESQNEEVIIYIQMIDMFHCVFT